MFEPNKPIFMTRFISKELSQEHQQFIIQYIIEHHQLLTDYLQVFDFYPINNQQWLLQRQEQPNRETIHIVRLKDTEAIELKVWVMDQGSEGIIILFPEDY